MTGSLTQELFEMLPVESYKPTIGTFYFGLVRQISKQKKSCDVKSRNKVPAFLLRVMIYHMLIIILYASLHYGSVRISDLTREGIESNPGSFSIRKEVNASHHQGHMKIQQGCNLQAILTFLLCFQSLRTLASGGCLTYTMFLRRGIKHSNMLGLKSH